MEELGFGHGFLKDWGVGFRCGPVPCEKRCVLSTKSYIGGVWSRRMCHRSRFETRCWITADWSVLVGVVAEIHVCVGDGVAVAVEKEEDRAVGRELIRFIGGI